MVIGKVKVVQKTANEVASISYASLDFDRFHSRSTDIYTLKFVLTRQGGFPVQIPILTRKATSVFCCGVMHGIGVGGEARRDVSDQKNQCAIINGTGLMGLTNRQCMKDLFAKKRWLGILANLSTLIFGGSLCNGHPRMQ